MTEVNLPANVRTVNLGVSYSDVTRQVWVSLMFIIPIMGIYEVAIVLSQAGQNNAVNSALKVPFMLLGQLLGRQWIQWFNAFLILLFFWVGCLHEDRGGHVNVKLFVFMALESVLWGVLLSGATLLPLKTVLPNSLAAPIRSREFVGITLSVGAGMYEEILFRHLLAGQLCSYLTGSRGWRGPMEAFAVVLSLVLSSGLFSAMHYVGPLGDVFTMTSFLFRFGAGIALGIIYFTRGLGIAVYAHATYDVLLVLGLV